MRRLADDPLRPVLERLIELSGPALRWVPLSELTQSISVEGFDDPQTEVAYVSDYLDELEQRLAVERNRIDVVEDELRPTTLAIEALLEADEV